MPFYGPGHNRSAAATKRSEGIMVQIEISPSEQKVQAIRDHLRSEDDERRRPGRTADVNPNLVPLLRGEAVPYRLLSDERNPPYELEHATPRFPLATYLILVVPPLGILGLVTWAILR